MFGSFVNSAASIGTPYAFEKLNNFSASVGGHGSSVECKPGQLARETFNFVKFSQNGLTFSLLIVYCIMKMRKYRRNGD